MDHSVLDHDGPWTEEAYLALRGSGRVELVDGALLLGPGTSARCGRVGERVRAEVAAALPAGLRVVGPLRLRLGPDCIVVPDLVVTAADAAEGEVLDADVTLMVIEIVGHEHGAVDRSFKPHLYARSRIPYSLLVDHDNRFAAADMLIGGRYHEYSSASGAQPLHVEEPFTLELDLDELARVADEELPSPPRGEPDPVPAGERPAPAAAGEPGSGAGDEEPAHRGDELAPVPDADASDPFGDGWSARPEGDSPARPEADSPARPERDPTAAPPGFPRPQQHPHQSTA